MGPLQLAGQRPSRPQPLGRIRVRKRAGQASVDAATLGLWQVLGDVAALVHGAALDQRELTEHAANRRGQRLGAVDDHQQPPGGVQTSALEVGEQVAHHGGVLGRTLPQPTGSLAPSAKIASATTQQRSATWMPSSSSAAMCSCDRSRANSSSSALAVSATNRREIADLDVALAVCWTTSPTGSAAWVCRRLS